MSASTPSRIGVVGYGAGGHRFHVPYIQAVEGWELAGVVTRSPQRRAILATEAPGVAAFDSLDALLDSGVDAVVITTPPDTRRELVLQALERGVHVVADKPFAPTAEGARELQAAAARSGRILTAYQNRRWDTDLVTLKQTIDAGSLGEIWRVSSRMDQDDSGTLETGPAHGLLRDLGSHLVDQMAFLFGRVERVSAHLDTATVDGVDVDCGFDVALHHANGVFSRVASSKINHLEGRELIAYGDLGSYESHMDDVQTAQIDAGLRPASAAAATDWGIEAEGRWGILHTAAGSTAVPSARGHYSEFYRQFLAAVRGEGPAPVPLEQAVHTVEILDAARESARTRRTVTL
ncbi:Gfo/Idh/MocA family protein [Pseudoclavibacter terrae]|uniref:Gfo/Idh/MocA family oxidoreductase n=1 Tax=Pseudoclavibacter terrae TaxID=1530195 RepID=A0A7J5B3U1_9MICO|nr:Gfo/Idh/MocA family oxidoreductase [Pseudoclavibacter terrae]KAB1638842.1 Gfo/Idh/MocA family oxidoreductase [Pseudoclavibacter terrae]